jgi:hypothetical protein
MPAAIVSIGENRVLVKVNIWYGKEDDRPSLDGMRTIPKPMPQKWYIKNREAIEKEIAELNEKSEKLAKAMESAALAGDMARYKSLKIDKEDADDLIEIKTIQLSNMQLELTEEDVLAAWKDFLKEYNTAFDKVYKVLEKKRGELMDAFKDCLVLQAEAIRVRERCGELIGLSHDQEEEQLLFHRLPRPSIETPLKNCAWGGLNRTPDLALYMAYHNESKAPNVVNGFVTKVGTL